MTDVPARGALSQMAMDASSLGIGSTHMEFLSCGLKGTNTHAYSSGIRGERSRHKSRARIVATDVRGPIVLQPSATEIDFLLPYILGGTTAAGVTDVADTLPEFIVGVDKVSEVFTYSGCRVGRCVIQGNAGQPLTWTLDISAESESAGAAGSFPAITLNTDNFFVFSDLTLTLESSARKFRSFTLTIDNLLDDERRNNALSPTEISAQDRAVQLTVDAPYTSDNTDLHGAAIAGAAGSLVFTDGTDTYTVDFGNCKIPEDGPTVDGKSEIQLPLTVDCLKSGTSDSEIKFTKT